MFNQLINPIHPNLFFSEYWEKKPLILLGKKHEYEKLFTLQDADILLNTLTTPKSFVRFINQKQELPLNAFVQNGSPFLDLQKVMAGFHTGNTIVLNSLQHRHEPIRRMCYSLEETFGSRVGVNMYLTPSNAQGFGAHFDAHDVLILQIDGEKIWKIYDHHVLFPIAEKDTPFVELLSAPIHEVTIKKGDLLYIPRGVVHEALTANTHSLHLTVGIHVMTWLDLINEVCLGQTDLRKALPIGLLSNPQEIADIPRPDFERHRLNEALQKLRHQFSSRRIPSFQVGLAAMASLHPEMVLRKKGGMKHTIVSKKGEIALQVGKTSLSFPEHLELFFDHINNESQFSVSTMPDYLEYLPQEFKLSLLRKLLAFGFLEQVAEDS